MKMQRYEQPNPQLIRSKTFNLNGEWEFSFDEPVYDKKINIPFSWASLMSGIGDYDKKGTGYYRRFVRYNNGNNRLFIVFEGVDYECEVTVNGTVIGTHIGAYATFSFDITDNWDSDGENEIRIKVTDNDEDYQMRGKQGYGEARGIWQDMYLEERPGSYIEKFRITTKNDGNITISAKIAGSFEKFAIETECGDFASDTDTISFKLEKPVLWELENPYLYECKLKLYSEAGTDEIDTYFGIREVGYADFDGKKYITLNGKPVYVQAALDQSFHTDGYYTFPSAEYTRAEIERAKALGLNALRIHVKAEDPRKLYWADKLGVLIIEDIPCFWGTPTDIAKEHFEKQMYEIVDRDINHPAIFYWVIFNETWGLFSKPWTPEKEYTKETQDWVHRLFSDLKKYDPTRLVEDNSPCNQDHIETDVNTWHFYINGYENVKEECEKVSRTFVPGSSANYIGENVMGDIPVMNSECGNYWGIEGNPGDSDIAWHYKYMMNEFRLHERIGGFVFTELKDVVNEFNGYYRIDDTPKYFGYNSYVEDMTVEDLHSSTYLGFDFPPMSTMNPGQKVVVPMFISSFDEKYQGRELTVKYEPILRKADGEIAPCTNKEFKAKIDCYGTTKINNLTLEMPDEAGVFIVKLYLCDSENIIMRNFVLFDVVTQEEKMLSIDNFTTDGFKCVKTAQEGNKLNCLGEGTLILELDTDQLPKCGAEVIFEASSRRIITHERDNGQENAHDGEIEFMHGYRVDRGENPNSFFMTGEKKHISNVTVSVNGIETKKIVLPDCPADASGCLSWHYQKEIRCLDEAGSYGYLVKIEITPEMLLGDKVKIELSTDNGISVFGRKSGMYPVEILIK